MNLGQKFLKQAKKIIPGGNQLLSKRSEFYLPNLWPSYYKKAKGCKIWDLENNMYYDFAGMGVTSCVLGYSDKDLNSAIIKGLQKGSMTTLNSTDEIKLAKKLIKIHKWAGMAKFCKSGGEACMVAIRIARAFSGKQNIAFCGYHGWHDWYLATNMQNSKNLDKQHLTGLSTKGVSKTYAGTIKPFDYNDLKSFKKIVLNKKNEIGIVIMEPMRGVKPTKGFLQNIREITRKNKIILIFDEITSGFKDNYGGIHLKFNVNPDIAIYGKSIGNGYPISAIIGKKKIMQTSQESFISSTMWTDSLGFIAANTTLNKLKKFNVNNKIKKFGKIIKRGWTELAKKNKISITVSGLDSIPSFKFNYNNNLEISTYFAQEMLRKGFLANTTLTTSLSFNKIIINKYLKEVDRVFNKINYCLKLNKFPLKSEIKHSTFRRLTG